MINWTHSRILPFVMLTGSNIFMTCAWYGHLKYGKDKPIWLVILVSWSIAFFEYMLQVPANRWGSNVYSAAQLKVAQEIITLTVFSFFMVYYLQVSIKWNHLAAFACMIAAACFIFLPKS